MVRFVLFLCFLAGTPAFPQGSCAPSLLGQPCGQGGVATLASSEPGLNPGVGNPIHLATGNKYQQELDLPANTASPWMEIVRHYNALDRRRSTLGQGWTLSYDTRLFFRAGRWQIVQADGSRITFPRSSRHTQSGHYGFLITTETQKTWIWPSGRKIHFNSSGHLIRIESATENAIDIHRSNDAGPLFATISRITGSPGGTLSFDYRIEHDQAYLTRIDTVLGSFQYFYEPVPAGAHTGNRGQSLRLQRLVRPDGMQRHYLYEPQRQAGNPHLLTGINITSADQKNQQRLNTWGYDAQGRAVLSIKGSPESSNDRIAVQYIDPPNAKRGGLTETTNALGHTTRFRTAVKNGRYVLVGVSGAACPGCSAPDSTASYDRHGRLSAINKSRITRYKSGHIKQINPDAPGWPGLTLRYRPSGQKISWSSSLTGTEHILYNARHLPAARIFSNGDRWEYEYDDSDRPIKLTEKNQATVHVTKLGWSGNSLTHIAHPLEIETREYDKQNRLAGRTINRISVNTGVRLHYTERFDYDDRNRLAAHFLPEGGALRYQWGAGNQLLGISWQDPYGGNHPVIRSTARQPGYQYGNGLRLRVTVTNGQAGTLTVDNTNTQTSVWAQQLEFDAQGRIQQERHHAPSAGHLQAWRYAYDTHSRLAAAQNAADDTRWYAWRNDGSLAAQRTHARLSSARTFRPAVSRDHSGLPQALDGYTLHYGPNRRLSEVRRGATQLDTYQHNAFGQRITRQSQQDRTDYFYLNNQVVAESRHNMRLAATPASPSRIPAITRRYIYAGHVLVGLIDYPQASGHPDLTQDRQSPTQNSQAQLYAVHSDLIGAPRLVTDSRQKIRWLADYSPTGTATQIAGDLTLDVRLPGQISDQTTGWHDNLLRTYVPAMGQYLESDPLGPIPANQAIGYAKQQPRRYVDPLGLLLFAFDGTRNSPLSQTNVWKMAQQYQDGPVFYQSGPGNPSYFDWDAVTAYSAPTLIETQWQHLLNQLSQAAHPNDSIPIDIIGFSRGAALARYFGNLINDYVKYNLFSYTDKRRGLITACVDLRFMGLFDTVAQFGLHGNKNSLYDLTIAPAWQWVAHAVALQERRWLYPLTSAADTAGTNIIEAPFIGAHADIGGGVSFDVTGAAQSAGDLSDVALNWMLWQARAASLRFDTTDPEQQLVTEPVLHDERSALVRSIQNGDRSIDAADGSALHMYQDDHARLGRSQRDATEQFIERYDNWPSTPSSEVGTINMDGYAQWLHDELGWQAPPA